MLIDDKETIRLLTQIGADVLKYLRNNEPPKVAVPLRTTSNIKYDPKYRCYVLAGKYKVRSCGNIKHIRKVAQLLRVARFCKDDLIKQNKHATLRELYYISESWGKGLKFEEQAESNDMLEDIEAMISKPREALKITPEDKGGVYGDLTVEYRDPKGRKQRINCLNTPDGLAVGPRLDEAKIIECNASRVIAIETGGMYDRLIEEGAYEKFDAILVHLGGQSTRSARMLLKRLNQEQELPVYIFTDADPWGMHIAMVIISGSSKAAHINKELAVPDAKWIGVTASDIVKYNLRTDPMNEKDIKRCDELLKDPRYNDQRLRKEIELFLKLKRKAEQQALAKYGLSYVVEEYLPIKLREFET